MPTRDSILAKTAADVVRLVKHSPDVTFVSPLGIYIAALRTSCVDLARQMGASHLLFVDADMRFPADLADRLLARDVDVVGANYLQRTQPHLPVTQLNGLPVSSTGRTGLQAVDILGTGALLIKLSVFDRLPKPWFQTHYEGDQYVGEDVYFCRLLQAYGMPLYVDHDASQQVRHQSTCELSIDTFALEHVA